LLSGDAALRAVQCDSESTTLQGGTQVANTANREREPLLDPVDRISEVLFGLIMAVTIVGSLSIATAGRNEVRTVVAAALGCNLAWGLVDAVMYLVRTLTARTRGRALARRVIEVDAATAHRLIQDALPPQLIAITGPEEIEGMRRRLLALPPPHPRTLRRADYLAALAVFLFVVIATFPVVLPFMLAADAVLAMRISQLVTLTMLFLAGFALGRFAGHTRPLGTGLAMALLGAALIVSVKALGG
jgi:VIT1/CCC1 family predicted Fe2+/Mn2+ transporter